MRSLSRAAARAGVLALAAIGCVTQTARGAEGDGGGAATRPVADGAVAGLVLRFRHGTPGMQERAARELSGLVGDAAGRLLASTVPDDELVSTCRADLRAALVGWRAADPVRYLLDSPEADAPRRAVAGLVELAHADPGGFAALSPAAKSHLVDALGELTGADAGAGPAALDLIESLGAARAPALRLLARLAADERADPALRAGARGVAAGAVLAQPRGPAAIAGLAAALANPHAEPEPAPEPAAPAVVRVKPPDLDENTTELTPDLAPVAVGRVAYGEFGVLAVVKRSEANTGAFLDAATDRLTTRAAGHAEFLNVIRAIGRVAAPAQIDKRPALRARLGEFLVWGSDASPGVLVPGPLDRARPIDPEELAEAAAGLLGGPLARADVQDALADVVRRGQRLSGRGLRALKLDPREFASRLLPHLTAGPAEARRAAAGALVAVGVGADDAATRAALESCLRSTDEPLRDLAADALNTPRAHDLARVPAVLRDLRSENPATRSTAARRFQSLGVEPPEVGAALVRATDARDLATREGLCVALERGFATARPAKDVLADLAAAANPDATTRTYARAALRQLNGP